MTKVEVDLADLETIVFATAVIKNIETLLASRKQDPFVKPHLDYTEAHDRLVQAMNHAKRSAVASDFATNWDEPLSVKEALLMKKIALEGMIVVTGEERQKWDQIDSLASKGCVDIGQCVEGTVWPGAKQADLKPSERFGLRITHRGFRKLKEIENGNTSTIS